MAAGLWRVWVSDRTRASQPAAPPKRVLRVHVLRAHRHDAGGGVFFAVHSRLTVKKTGFVAVFARWRNSGSVVLHRGNRL